MKIDDTDKKRAAANSPSPKAAAAKANSCAKERKVSSARQDAAMAAMTTELSSRRGADELSFIAGECGASADSRMTCYAVCVKNKKKRRESDNFFHRNNAVIVHISIYQSSQGTWKLSRCSSPGTLRSPTATSRPPCSGSFILLVGLQPLFLKLWKGRLAISMFVWQANRKAWGC